MKQTQLNQILTLLDDGSWHCTSQMAAMYMVDYRRRIVDLKEKGHKLESRRCTQHSHPMKEWRLLPEAKQWWLDERYQKQPSKEDIKQQQLI